MQDQENDFFKELEKVSKEQGLDWDFNKNQTIEDSNEGKQNIDENFVFSALELYNAKVENVPKLLDPFYQKVGLAALVGTSDTGKSTFLRHLSLSIVLGLDSFLGFKLNSKYNRVLYISTEDDSNSISYTIRKQIDGIKLINENVTENLLNEKLQNLTFICNSENIINILKNKLSKENYDLVVIDAFTDVFSKEINANTQVRHFLNQYDNLAKKYQCLFIFLHHIGKGKDSKKPSKDSIIGSQAFEAKMRAVLELKPHGNNENVKDLWVLKSNFLDATYKKNSYILNFNNLLFENTNNRGSIITDSFANNLELRKQIESLMKNNSVRKITELLNKNGWNIGHASVGKIVKDLKS